MNDQQEAIPNQTPDPLPIPPVSKETIEATTSKLQAEVNRVGPDALGDLIESIPKRQPELCTMSDHYIGLLLDTLEIDHKSEQATEIANHIYVILALWHKSCEAQLEVEALEKAIRNEIASDSLLRSQALDRDLDPEIFDLPPTPPTPEAVRAEILRQRQASRTAADLIRVRAEPNEKLREAAKKAMHCLTAETEEQWKRTQAHPEAPYHFLYEAIMTSA